MMKNEPHIECVLPSLRVLQQKGDIEAAKESFEENLSKSISVISPSAKAFYGVLLLLCNEPEKGKKFIREASEPLPDQSNLASDIGLGLLITGDIDQAIKYLELAVSLPDPEAAAFNRLGAAYLSGDNLEKAADAFEQALFRDPFRAEIHNNLGGINIRQGKLIKALEHYERAIELKKDLQQSLNGRKAILIELDRADDIIIEINEKIDKTSDEMKAIPDRQYIAGILEATGRFQEAISHMEKALRPDPENINVLLQLGTIFFDHFKYQYALKTFQKVTELEPDHIYALSFMARCLSELGKHGLAEQTAQKMFDAHPDLPVSYLTRAIVFSAGEKYREAEKDLKTVIDRLPGSAEAWSLLGHNLMHLGDIDKAVECFEKASKLNPSALSQLIEARVFPEDPKAIDKMIRLSANPLIHREPRTAMLFSLSRLFEKKTEYKKAFDFATRANHLVKRSHLFSFQKYRRLIDDIIATFAKEQKDRFKGVGSLSERPVFIVGMPRSGTTLVEQILSSHPDVFGAGELGYIPAITALMPKVIGTNKEFPLCMHELKGWMVEHAARYYLKKIYDLNNHAAKVTDKLPQNFFYIGLISIIFPKASIIHVKRNLKDIAVSNYFTNFKYKNGILGYSFSLEDIGHMLNGYREIMSHYREGLDIPFYEISYESLVENPEQEIRGLLNYAGLPWDDRVLKFYKTQRPVKTASVWQVRQPLYGSSAERWKHYEPFLGPLDSILEKYGKN